MIPINWLEIFQDVSARGDQALEWRLPEPWVHAELFVAIKHRAGQAGWFPFPIEIPYVTLYPVTIPGKGHSNWREHGAIKWVDLCIRNQDEHLWCWFEFKVRHAGAPNRSTKASKQARDAFRKDVVALLGFDPQKTSSIWATPDKYTTAYWFANELEPHAKNLANEKHLFASAFLQLNGNLNDSLWNQMALLNEIRVWMKCRQAASGFGSDYKVPPMKISSHSLNEGHSLVICEWEAPEE